MAGRVQQQYWGEDVRVDGNHKIFDLSETKKLIWNNKLFNSK